MQFLSLAYPSLNGYSTGPHRTVFHQLRCKRDLIKGSCKVSSNLAKSGITSRLSLIVGVNVVLNRTVVFDSD